MQRFVSTFLVLLVCLFVPSAAFGYGLENMTGEQVVDRGVSVENVLLDQAAYAVGDTAILSFEVSNGADVVQHGLMYRVDVVGNFDEATSEPTSRFTLGDVTSLPHLLPGQTHTVELRSVLPQYVASGDLGFQVSVFNSATELVSRGYVRLLVTGTVRPSVTYIAQVQVDGEPFGLAAGPTVYKGEQVAFATSLKSSRGSYSLTPHVAVYEGFSPVLSPIDAFEGETVPVGTTRSTEQRMLLPHFDYRPGSYVALITYKDAEGTAYAGPFAARYVIAGGEPTLHSALPTRLEVPAGESFDVVVTYNDTPKNIALDASFDPAAYTGTMETEVAVVDANNTIISQSRASFLPGKTTVRVPVTAPHYIHGMRIVAKLYEDGEPRDTLDVMVPDVHSLVASSDEVAGDSFISKHQTLLIAGSALALLILFAVGIWLHKRRQVVA